MSHRRMFSISLIVVATGALIAPIPAIAAPTASIADAASHAVDDTVMTQLTSAAKQLLGSRAGELVADQKPMTVDTRIAAVGVTAQAAQRESNVRSRVRANRAWLNKRSEAYTGSRTTLEETKATRKGTTISLRATEVTYLDYARIHGDEPPNTAYTADHEFVYEATGAGGWTLLEDRQLEPTGLLPLREAVTYVYGNASMPTNTAQSGQG